MVKAVRYGEFGGVEGVRGQEGGRPVPGGGQGLVPGQAGGIQRRGGVLPAGAGPGGGRSTLSSSKRAKPSSAAEQPGGSARSPSSAHAVPGPRSSAWRARTTTSGLRAAA